MSALNIFSTPASTRILASSIFMAMLAMTTAAQAESPYIQLYKDSVQNTNTATNTEQDVPNIHVTYPIRYKAGEGLEGINLLNTNLPQIPTPAVAVSDISYIPTVLIPQTQSRNPASLDVSLIEDFITEANSHARHYPPRFDNITQRYNTILKLKEFEEWLRPFSDAPNASYEVLLLATKLNGIGRNLDLGADFITRSSNYVTKALRLQPNSAEANFLYGMMLSEGGGFAVGGKYLEKAARLGYVEAEQSLAQIDLLKNRRSQALSRLRQLSAQNPSNLQIQQQVRAVENGDYYIWNLPPQAN